MKRLFKLLIIVASVLLPLNVDAAEFVRERRVLNNEFDNGNSMGLMLINRYSIYKLNDTNFVVFNANMFHHAVTYNKKFKNLSNIQNFAYSQSKIYSFNNEWIAFTTNGFVILDSKYELKKNVSIDEEGWSLNHYSIGKDKIYLLGRKSEDEDYKLYVVDKNYNVGNYYSISADYSIIDFEIVDNFMYFTTYAGTFHRFNLSTSEVVQYSFKGITPFEVYVDSKNNLFLITYDSSNNSMNTMLLEVPYSFKFVKLNKKEMKEEWSVDLVSSTHVTVNDINIKEFDNGNYFIGAGSFFEVSPNGKIINSCVKCTDVKDAIYLDNQLVSISLKEDVPSQYSSTTQIGKVFLDQYALKYKLTQNEAVNGRYRVNRPSPRSGEKVIIKLRIEEGYELDTIKVTKADKSEVRLTKLSDKEYSFVMPEADTTIDVAYKEIKE